nr:hypothetical protein [uncultured Sphingomonas sp.]
MRVVMMSLAVAALCACSKPAETPAANADVSMDANMDMNGDMNMDANMVTPAAFDIRGTSWEFTDNGKAMQESIDDKGNYITTSGTEHIDHGTAVMKDGKACFTSAMNKDGEMCWTDPQLQPDQSGKTVSDKGQALDIKRIDYVAKTM